MLFFRVSKGIGLNRNYRILTIDFFLFVFYNTAIVKDFYISKKRGNNGTCPGF